VDVGSASNAEDNAILREARHEPVSTFWQAFENLALAARDVKSRNITAQNSYDFCVGFQVPEAFAKNLADRAMGFCWLFCLCCLWLFCSGRKFISP